MLFKRFYLLAAPVGLVMLMIASPVSLADAHPAGKAALASVNPANFVNEVDNEYFPLKPGTTYFYSGTKDGVPTTNEFFVTHETKKILGVTTIVVHDRAFEDGVLAEQTIDWFAQDKKGNVWYFGEDTKELDPQGHVISTKGTWQAGVNSAQPGIVMEGEPHVGDKYNQELAPRVAEDKAQVLSLNKSRCVPYGCFDELLLTKEWSPLKPGVVEQKYYAEDVGFIRGTMVKGGSEITQLVRITHD